MTTKPKNKPLKATITRNGTLRIEIGINVLASAACFNAYNNSGREYEVTHNRGFALDVVRALEEESETGDSIITGALDTACELAIEDGTEWFREKPDCPYQGKHASDCTCRGAGGDR